MGALLEVEIVSKAFKIQDQFLVVYLKVCLIDFDIHVETIFDIYFERIRKDSEKSVNMQNLTPSKVKSCF